MKSSIIILGVAAAALALPQDALRLRVEPDPGSGPATSEYARVYNESLQPVELADHRLCDAIGACFLIPEGTTIAPGDSITLVTGRGVDAPNVFHWGGAVAVWNNTGDVALLLDSAGREVTRFGYGDQPEVRMPGQANPSAPPSSAPPPRRTCCRVCRAGKACGNSCIARSNTCRQPPGCACNGGDEEFFASLMSGLIPVADHPGWAIETTLPGTCSITNPSEAS